VRVSREQMAENRRRIVEAASRLFREKGFDGIGIDGIMKEAGLTHGGFYGHFESKDDLIAHACAHASAAADYSWASAPDPVPVLATAYLSPDHCANPADGCLLAALGSEIPRQDGGARRAFTEDLRARVDQLTSLLPGRSRAARREKAIATWAGLVGAMVLARAVDDASFSDEILKAGVAAFGAKPPAGDGSAPPKAVRSRHD
jgi:TetR/AcrR family transcriptional regulator, transcriptional repressor for nem operon